MSIVKRLVIFEGVDGAGKTTLAKHVANVLDADLIHHGPYQDITGGVDLAEIYEKSTLNAVYGLRNVILDRSWISEEVYGAVYRDGANRLAHIAQTIERRLVFSYDLSVVVVFCVPLLSRVIVNLSMRDEAFDPTKIREVYNAYLRHDELTDLPRIRVDPFEDIDHVGRILSWT